MGAVVQARAVKDRGLVGSGDQGGRRQVIGWGGEDSRESSAAGGLVGPIQAGTLEYAGGLRPRPISQSLNPH